MDNQIKLKRKFEIIKKSATVICNKSINHMIPLICSSKYSVSHFTNKNRRKRFARLSLKEKQLIKKGFRSGKRKVLLKPYIRKQLRKKTFLNIFPEFTKDGLTSHQRLRISEHPFGASIQSFTEEYNHLKSLYGYVPAAFILPRYYAIQLDKAIWNSKVFLTLYNYIFLVAILIFLFTSTLYSYFHLGIKFSLAINYTALWWGIILLLILFYYKARQYTAITRDAQVYIKFKSLSGMASFSDSIKLYLAVKVKHHVFLYNLLNVLFHTWMKSWRTIFLFVFCVILIGISSLQVTFLSACLVVMLGLFLSDHCWRIRWNTLTIDLTNIFIVLLIFHMTDLGNKLSDMCIGLMENIFIFYIRNGPVNRGDILSQMSHEKENIAEKYEILVSIVSIITSSLMSVFHHLNNTISIVMTIYYLTFFFINCTPVVAFFLFNLLFFEFSSILQCLAPLFCILTPHEMLICCVAGISKLSMFKIAFLKVRYGIESLYLVSSVFSNTFISIFFVRLLRPEKYKSLSTLWHLERITTIEGNNWVDAFLAGGLNAIRVSLLSIAIAVILASLIKLVDMILSFLPELLFCFTTADFSFAKIFACLFAPLFMVLYKLDWSVAWLAGHLFSMRLIIYNYDPFDYLFRNHIAIRWISDCWRVSFSHKVYENSTHTIYHDHFTNLIYSIPGRELEIKEEIIILNLLMHNLDMVNILQMFAIMAYHIIYRNQGALSIIKNTILVSFIVILFSTCQIANTFRNTRPITCDIDQAVFCRNIYRLFHLNKLSFNLEHICYKAIQKYSHNIGQRTSIL